METVLINFPPKRIGKKSPQKKRENVVVSVLFVVIFFVNVWFFSISFKKWKVYVLKWAKNI